jgi:hypothetical protein
MRGISMSSRITSGREARIFDCAISDARRR